MSSTPTAPTRYDDWPEHPLFGVPAAVLAVARTVMADAAQTGDVDADMADPLADAVVLELRRAGHITWDIQGPSGPEPVSVGSAHDARAEAMLAWLGEHGYLPAQAAP